MNVKRLIALFLCIVLIAGFTSVNASAEEIKTVVVYESKLPGSDYYATNLLAETDSVDLAELREYIFENIYSCKEEIDVSKFGILVDNRAIISNLIFYDMPEAFHVDGSISFSYLPSTRVTTAISMTYDCTADQYKVMYEAFENAADDMTKDLKTDSLTDVQKALLLHDRLVIKCEYDTGVNSGTGTEMTYTAYGAIVEGIAVCQGYAEGYDYLLEKVGIDSFLCSSNKLNHAWNIVDIDGKYYHVDVTWDDPVFNPVSSKPAWYVPHENFLLSSNAFYENGHDADDYNTAPCDTTFEGYFWEKIKKEFYLIGKDIYYYDNTGAFCGYDEQQPLVSAGLGDIDGDNKINSADISYCRNFLTEFDAPESEQTEACDMNKDGEINMADLVRFKKILTYI